ncbi:MAG: hypothetical protein HFH72_08930 [Lachnospiraceae bacterium]|nr:hypothetical protein [Lachnospiraceae bacterium]
MKSPRAKGMCISVTAYEGELSEFETMHYAKSLIAKGYITADLTNYYITEIGKKNYQP